MSKQTLLMTGASGLVGSRIGEMLSDTYTIGNIDLTTGVNILDKSSINTFIDNNPGTALVHLAAFTNTQEAFKQAGDKSGVCYQVNVVGTQNIAEVCKERGIHLLHISTDFVFDGAHPPEGGYQEDSPRSPIEWYGETKAMAEEEVEKSGAKHTILRIAYPYRANFELKPDIVTKIRQGLKTGTLPPQFSDTLMTPTFVDDIARSVKAIIEKGATGIYHITGSSILSPYDLSRKVAAAYGYSQDLVKEGSLTQYLETNPRPFSRYSSMNNAKATRELGVTFATIDQGLTEVKKQEAQ